MKTKKVLWVYIFAVTAIITTVLICVPSETTKLYGLITIILLTMMIATEYIEYGKGNRLFLDIALYIGMVIGIALGIFNNPNLNFLLTNSTVISFTFIVLVRTYLILKDKKKP